MGCRFGRTEIQKSITNLEYLAPSMAHSIDHVIDSQFDRSYSGMERHLAFIDPFPELTKIVIVIRNKLQVSVFVVHSPELRNEAWCLGAVGWFHREGVDVVERMEDRVVYIKPYEFAFGYGSLQVVT